MPADPVRVAVHGSCVTRDVIRIVPEPFELKTYIARQSWVSAFTDPVSAPNLSHVASAFQARNLRGDFESSAGSILRRLAEETDIVVIDIASDRHGVAKYRGGYVSLTPDHTRAFGGMIGGGRRVHFASEEHLQLFSGAVQRGAELMQGVGLLSKALVLRVPFTDLTVTGEPITSAAQPAAAINAKYEPYYDAFAAAGFAVVDLPGELAVADPDHTFGLTQDHFAAPAYHWWAEQIVQFARREATVPRG